jgi:hypothetical protein
METVIERLLTGQYIKRVTAVDRNIKEMYQFWDTGLEISYFHSSFFILKDIDTIIKYNDKWYLFTHYNTISKDTKSADIDAILSEHNKYSWIECKDVNLLQYRLRITFDEL